MSQFIIWLLGWGGGALSAPITFPVHQKKMPIGQGRSIEEISWPLPISDFTPFILLGFLFESKKYHHIFSVIYLRLPGKLLWM